MGWSCIAVLYEPHSFSPFACASMKHIFSLVSFFCTDMLLVVSHGNKEMYKLYGSVVPNFSHIFCKSCFVKAKHDF